MNALFSGPINDFNPVFFAFIDGEQLLLHANGNLSLTVDTGFNGYIALPEKILSKLKLKFSAYDNFLLANGSIVKLKVYLGNIKVGTQIFETLFIPGDYLIGMRCLFQIGKKLIVDIHKKEVTLY